MKIIIVLIFVVVMFFIGVTIMICVINNSMTRGYDFKHGKGTYKDFLREFNDTKWDDPIYPMFKYSLFSRESDSELHAGTTKFNGVGMTFNYFSSVRKSIFLYRFILKNRKNKDNYSFNYITNKNK